MARELLYQKVITKPFEKHSEYLPIRKWCIAHFGPSVIKGSKERPWHGHMEHFWDDRYHNKTYRYNGIFYFRDRAAATMFALRWS